MVLGTMVCPSFVLGGDANTGSADYVCLETELENGESDFHAVMLGAFASAAFLGLPSFFAVVCLAVLAALTGLFFALLRLQGFFVVCVCLLRCCFLAALSDGHGGFACCVEYSLEFLVGAATLIAPFASENTQLFILMEMVEVALCAENWVPGSSQSGPLEERLF